MDTATALQIVIDLAKQNVVNEHDMPDEHALQMEAIAVLEDTPTPAPAPMPERTNELLTALTVAQLQHVHEMTTSDGEYSGIQNALHSDDSYDYLRAALNLGSTLLGMQYDNDLAGFTELLDPASDEFVVENHACDGICQAVYDALPADWEDRRDAYHGFKHKRLSDCE